MKKGILILLVIMLLGISPSFADRNTSTIKGYSSDTLIKRGDWKIYRIDFIATANSGNFAIYDSLTEAAVTDTNIKTEGSEATSKNGKHFNFYDKPLEGSTGLYLIVNDATVVIEYE